MRIGLLQFNPAIGAVEANVARAKHIIHATAKHGPLDLLVLPEMALSGYAYSSANHIRKYLEPCHGPSLAVASELCRMASSSMVVMGYPERGADGKAYNACMVVRRDGHLVYNYRKTHLFETDKSWAMPGTSFGVLRTSALGKTPRTIALGICMDMNPHEFKAPFDAYEFGSHCVHVDADIIIVPMAWTKAETPTSHVDDLHAVRYWLARLGPLLAAKKKVLFIACDRTGSEDKVAYQGNSCVVLIDHGQCTVLGKLDFEEALLCIDTDALES